MNEQATDAGRDGPTASFPATSAPGDEPPRPEGVGRAGPSGQTRPGADPGLAFLQRCENVGSLGRLAHYEVRRVLGRGGFGIVLEAFDAKLRRLVAIKVLDPGLADNAAARQRFLREARAAAAVSHENVVSVYDVNEQPVPFLVMEHVVGRTLQARIDANGPLELHEVLRLGRQISCGLAAAHATGLIHRDVKPANILLEGEPDREGSRCAGGAATGGRVRITDFGLACASEDGGTQSGVIAGTPLYMSPEQAQEEAIDHRSDLFSLGSVLYTLCAGRPAFQAGNSLAVLKRVSEDAPQPLREINPQVPAWLEAVITRLLAKDPGQRFQSAAEVVGLLGRCQTHGRQPGAVALPAALAPPRPVRRRRWPLAAGVAGLLVGLAVAAALLLLPRAPRPLLLAEKGRLPQVPDIAPPADLTPAQVAEVVARLKEVNPGFDGKVETKVVDGVVTDLDLLSDQVTDLSPLRAVGGVPFLRCEARGQGRGQLADLSPLKGLQMKGLSITATRVSDLSPLEGMPLWMFNCAGTRVSDLTPLRGMPLTRLFFGGTGVSNLSPLKGMPLEYLDFSDTRVSDLSPLRDLPLVWLKCTDIPITDLSPLKGKKLGLLWCHNTKVTDLSPLRGMPLTELWCDFRRERDAETLRSLTSLETINGKPARDFWKEVDK
jgi:hypothetical protein